MFKFIVQKVVTNKRRVAVVETVDLRVLQDNIKFHITMLEKEGRNHFSRNLIMNRLNEDIGWPVKSDPKSMDLFKQLFKQEVSRYQPSLKSRNCYSFQLKPSANHNVQAKVLKN